MKLVNFVWILVFAAAALCAPASVSFAQGDEDPLETEPVLQGNFGYIEKKENKKKEDFQRSDMTMVSEGTTFVSGGRVRESSLGQFGFVCDDVVWFTGGTSKTDRSDKRLKAKQKDLVDITFVAFSCEEEVPVCVLSESATVEVTGCSATTKTNAKQTLKKGLPPVGQSKFNCKNGINVQDPSFEMDAATIDRLLNVYPDIRSKFQSKFSDDAGKILEPDDAVDRLSPDLGLDDCEA